MMKLAVASCGIVQRFKDKCSSFTICTQWKSEKLRIPFQRKSLGFLCTNTGNMKNTAHVVINYLSFNLFIEGMLVIAAIVKP